MHELFMILKYIQDDEHSLKYYDITYSDYLALLSVLSDLYYKNKAYFIGQAMFNLLKPIKTFKITRCGVGWQVSNIKTA